MSLFIQRPGKSFWMRQKAKIYNLEEQKNRMMKRTTRLSNTPMN